MTPQEALKEAARAGRAGQFEVTRHALQRMGERGATRWDICLALRSATAAIQQDDDGRELIVVIVFTGRGIVVTVF